MTKGGLFDERGQCGAALHKATLLRLPGMSRGWNKSTPGRTIEGKEGLSGDNNSHVKVSTNTALWAILHSSLAQPFV